MSGGGGTYPPSSFHNNKGLQRPTIQPRPLHSHSQEQQNDGITLLGGRSEAKMGRFGTVAPTMNSMMKWLKAIICKYNTA
eukprot:scaffold104331_cov36-Attheya_sp.AAC.2